LVTKFTHGAWIVVILIPVMVYTFERIHRHYEYEYVAHVLSTHGEQLKLKVRRVKTIVLTRRYSP
jgi:hypothetical protein